MGALGMVSGNELVGDSPRIMEAGPLRKGRMAEKRPTFDREFREEGGADRAGDGTAR